MTHQASFTNNLNTDEATQLLKGMLKLDKPLPVGLTDRESMNFSGVDSKSNIDDDTMEEDSIVSQEIVFTDNEDDFAHRIHGQEVKIICSSENHSSGSSKVKIHNIVNYNWKHKYYLGRLVAVHISGNYLAYTITVQNKGTVRVVNPKTNHRKLKIGLVGQVKDLSFAHSLDRVLLACVDEYGSFVVHKIVDDDSELSSHCILSIESSCNSPSDYHMVFWCPFIPEEPFDLMESGASLVSDLLVVTNDKEVEVLDVALASNKYGGKTVSSKHVSVRRIIEHTKPITAATFSPDGTALATASCDGEVKFFEVDVQDKDTTTSCLHQWRPHDGKPVSCLFFLDNFKSPQPDVQFWKCALTGADDNRELKLWSCESWNCLQTIRFEAGAGESLQPHLKAEIDSSACYLILSDINYRVVYVLQLFQNTVGGNVNVCSIAKFSVTSPVLSMAIVDATICKFQLLGDPDHYQKHDVGEQNGDDEMRDGETVVKGVALKLFWISTKSIEESRITYQPPLLPTLNADESLAMLSQDSLAYRDRLSDLSSDIQDLLSDGSEMRKNNSFQSTSSQFPPNLMDNSEVLLTPDDFTSPAHSSTTAASCILTPSSLPLPPVTPSEESKLTSTPKSSLSMQDPMEPPLATSEEIPLARRKSSQHSSVSSPSQEVEDILAPVTVKEERSNSIFMNNISGDLDSEIAKNMNNLSLNSPGQTNSAPPSRKSGDFGAWPQAPDLSKESLKLASQKIDSNHLVEEKELLFQEEVIRGVGDIVTEDVDSKHQMLHKMNEEIESLNRSISELTGLVRLQGTYIQNLQADHIKRQNEHEKSISILTKSKEVTEKLCSKVDILSAEHSNTAKMKALFAEREDNDRKWLAKQSNALSQNLLSTASTNMEKTVKNEFKDLLLPQLTRSLDSWKNSVHQDINNSFSKIVKNKAFIDSIAQSVGSSIQPQIHSICQEVFINKLVPTVERVCHNLFLQISDTFKQGINEYLQQTKSAMEQFNEKCQKNLVASVNSQIEEQTKKMKTSHEQILHSLVPTIKVQVQDVLQESSTKQTDVLALKIKNIISEESKAMAWQHPPLFWGTNPAISSRAVTPVPHALDPQIFQQQILQLLHQGQYNAAFQQALSAADLNLVIFVCQSVKPSEVFGATAHPLKPPVLLSLIHQLGTDLTNNTDLKLKYLREALTSLDMGSHAAKDHIPNVLNQLRQKLTLYLQQNSKSPNITEVKMLLLVLQGLISSCS